MGESDCIVNSIIVGIVISFVMPRVVLMFAKPEEVKKPLQLDGLTETGKLMHLMAHKVQMPVIVALIVAFVVGASVYLGYLLKPMKMLRGN